ncbi:hypothetical protein X739_00890 [Mesorhizobium sp. LNHC220B00]|nr:hypothetical protein [Mesorhizobium sp. LNHC220B00]ESY88360.1 hypothetical protein X739_00890 [Mesorhizobium sp. LNHC220B00]
MSDRVGCINPRCRRTSKADGSGEMICGKCFRALPTDMRRRDRQCRRRLNSLKRKIERLLAKSDGRADISRLDRLHDAALRLFYRSWDRMRAYYQTPDKPAGLDTFLEEVGL